MSSLLSLKLIDARIRWLKIYCFALVIVSLSPITCFQIVLQSVIDPKFLNKLRSDPCSFSLISFQYSSKLFDSESTDSIVIISVQWKMFGSFSSFLLDSPPL